MSCSNSAGVWSTQARYYLIENVNQRFIPTYFHHSIFSQAGRRASSSRPVYRSQIIKASGNNEVQNGNQVERKDKMAQSTYVSHFKRSRNEPFCNQRGRNMYNSQSKWYDLGKTELLKNLDGMQGYSRERKMLDLASSQVFEGLTIADQCQRSMYKSACCERKDVKEEDRCGSPKLLEQNPEVEQRRQAIDNCISNKVPQAQVTLSKKPQNKVQQKIQKKQTSAVSRTRR